MQQAAGQGQGVAPRPETGSSLETTCVRLARHKSDERCVVAVGTEYCHGPREPAGEKPASVNHACHLDGAKCEESVRLGTRELPLYCDDVDSRASLYSSETSLTSDDLSLNALVLGRAGRLREEWQCLARDAWSANCRMPACVLVEV